MLTSFVTELRVRADRARGNGDVKVPDLGLFPDELIELLTPVVRRGFVAEGDPSYTQVVAWMDGEHTVRQIADRLVAESGWAAEHAFRYVRGVFLHLVSIGQSVPKR